eukprot:222575-Chlamydomonas_euryale.AAC.11
MVALALLVPLQVGPLMLVAFNMTTSLTAMLPDDGREEAFAQWVEAGLVSWWAQVAGLGEPDGGGGRRGGAREVAQTAGA